MGTINISVYVKTEDLGIYSENSEVLNQKAREAFERELSKIKESISKLNPMPVIPSELEDEAEEGLHEKNARKRQERASDKLYGVSMRHKKGKGVE